jgi:hypothetical protein
MIGCSVHAARMVSNRSAQGRAERHYREGYSGGDGRGDEKAFLMRCFVLRRAVPLLPATIACDKFIDLGCRNVRSEMSAISNESDTKFGEYTFQLT